MSSSSKLDTLALAALLPRLDLSPDAAASVAACALPSEALGRLIEANLLIEAARLVAHALPAREAVWWAARCSAATAPPTLPEADQEARVLAEAWVRERADPVRRSAMDKAQQAGCTSPEAWAAVAAFWSGDLCRRRTSPRCRRRLI